MSYPTIQLSNAAAPPDEARGISHMDLETFKEHLSEARTYVMMRYPFYNGLLNHFQIIADTSIPTACVTIRDEIKINPVFFKELGDVLKRAFLLCHELLHPALGIFWRGKGHDPRTSNEAHDYVINLILKAEDSSWLIKGILLDEKYDNMAYEEVYHRLMEEKKNRGGGMPGQDGEGSSGSGQCLPNSLGSDVDFDTASIGKDGQEHSPIEGSGMSEEEVAARWRTRLASAAQMAKMFGKLPAGLQRVVDEICNPAIPWQDHVQLFVSEAAHKSQLDWSQPSRRYVVQGFYSPREVYLGCDVAVYVDTSGSVSVENLRRAAAETREIIRCCGGRVRWICGDAEIAKEEWITEDEASHFEGGGGTSFVPLFEHLEDCPPKALIVITDTFGTFPKFLPHYPVLWAVYEAAANSGAEVPFGEMIVIPNE